ncbi:MAG TPA: cation:proton antiporter [Azospirillaceae bacterium]|nr:cation:proton antiporter [Azospirillaceae bacterium]
MQDIVPILLGTAGLLALVSLLPPLAQRLRMPFAVLLAAFGVALGSVIHGAAAIKGLGPLGDFFTALRGFDLTSEAFISIFLPILLFETALAVEVRRLMEDIGPILLLAVVAVLVTTLVVGFSLWAFTGIGLIACLLLASTLATTDPAAVIGIFRDLGAPRRLTMLVEGESLLNDAAAIALYGLLLGMLTGGQEADVWKATQAFVWSFGGGMAAGWACGRLMCLVVTPMRNLPLAEITLTVALAYLSFILAEHYLHVSGVVSVVAAALVVGSVGQTRISPETWGGLVQVWRQLGFWGSSLIFVFAAMLVPSILSGLSLADFGLLMVVVVAALVARGAVLFGLLPVLSAMGAADRVSHAYKAVMTWGGLRGAVSLALALAISENPDISLEVKRFVAVLATGYVLFTLFINGTTLRPLMRLLRLDRLPPAELAMRNRALALSLSNIGESVQVVARDYRIEPALSQEVADRYARRLAEIGELTQGPSHGLTERDNLYIGLSILATREEELYLKHFREGIISRTLTEILTERAGWLLDGVKTSGLAGYEHAARKAIKFSRQMRWAMRLHRWLRFDRPLARRLAIRFEALLIQRLVLRELTAFNERKLAPILGRTSANELGGVLERRLMMIEQALAALKLQYPDYATALQRQYLGRAALRLEEAEYRTMNAESIISQEVFNHLERDLDLRRRQLETPPRLDLGLDLAELVARVPIFQGLSQERLRGIARVLKARLALPGETLVRRGERGDSMYFISSGAVEVLVPWLQEPVHLGTGDFFGEMALLDGQPRGADVRALGYCQLLVLDERDWRRLIERDPDLKTHIRNVAEKRRAPAPVET